MVTDLPVARQDAVELWIGTYPCDDVPRPSDGGPAEGVWQAWFDHATGRFRDARLVQRVESPSFLALGRPGVVYAVSEKAAGALAVMATGGTTHIVPTGGAEPCHLYVHPELGVVVAHYGSGSVGVIRLDADGLPLPGAPHQVVSFHGSGPVHGRQDSAHAHFVFPGPGDPDVLLVCDLGSDKVRRLRIDRVEHRLLDFGVAVALPAGTGPRHAVFSQDGHWLYVVGELDGRIHQVAWDDATASGVSVGSTPVSGRSRVGEEGLAPGVSTPGSDPSTDVQPSHISRVGTTLIVGVRLADGLSFHHLAPDGSIGPGVFRALPGSNPRHHLDLPPWHLVALQDRGGVAVIDAEGRVSDTAFIPTPACVVTREPMTNAVSSDGRWAQ